MNDDLISRADAIKAICEDGTALERQGRHSLTMAERKQRDADILEALPPAQPDLDEWCRDCKEYDQERHSCPRWNRVIKHTVEDLKAEAQPERKKGKWIDKSGGIEGAWNYCSVCGEQAIDLYDYCPNCGADMRGVDDV